LAKIKGFETIAAGSQLTNQKSAIFAKVRYEIRDFIKNIAATSVGNAFGGSAFGFGVKSYSNMIGANDGFMLKRLV